VTFAHHGLLATAPHQEQTNRSWLNWTGCMHSLVRGSVFFVDDNFIGNKKAAQG